jgi:hypothetical protein
VVDRRTGSSSLHVSTSRPTSVVAQARCTIDEQPRLSTPRSPAKVVSTDNDEDKSKVEMVGVEMDDDSTSSSKRTTTTTAQQDSQLTDESRNFKEKPDPQSDLEISRQRQRQARRGPTSRSPPQAGSRKHSPVVSKTGMKRDREQYEEGQTKDEEDQVVGIDNPGIVGEQSQAVPVNGSISAKKEAIQTDIDNSSEEGEIVMVEREKKDDISKRRKGKQVSTDERQVTSQTEIQVPNSPTFSTATDGNPKVLGRWAYYTQYRDSSVPIPTPTQSSPSTQPPPPAPSGISSLSPSSPQARLPKKLGINHMDLLYKTEKEVMVCRICL